MRALLLIPTILFTVNATAAETAISDMLWDVIDDGTTSSAPQTPATPVNPTPGSSCRTPVVDPNYKNTPLEIRVDQETQIAKVYLNGKVMRIKNENGGMVDFVMYVSTGGGLKIPNGKYKKDPYCAKTPSFDTVVPAIEETDFDPSLCTPDEIRAKAMMFPVYYTNTFSDKNDQPIPMRNSIRLVPGGGWFIHEVPSGYRKYLGQNVSGECVRVPPLASRKLYELTKQYGGLKVKISEPPKVSRCKPQYCDEEFKAQAIRDIEAGRMPRTRYTGSEGLFGGDGIFGRFTCGGDNMRHTEGA